MGNFAKSNRIKFIIVVIVILIAYLSFFVFIKNFSVIGASEVVKKEEYVYFTLKSRLNFNNSRIFCGKMPDHNLDRYSSENSNPIIGELINQNYNENEYEHEDENDYILLKVQKIKINSSEIQTNVKKIYCKVGKMNFAIYYPDSNEITIEIAK